MEDKCFPNDTSNVPESDIVAEKPLPRPQNSDHGTHQIAQRMVKIVCDAILHYGRCMEESGGRVGIRLACFFTRVHKHDLPGPLVHFSPAGEAFKYSSHFGIY
ncbi:unnamed protein product [Cercopithifilaria johnstoni]|uniref:Uncharacterized protein n=1 Tax=Cercopithifilaria johnstoni TaxID=2874296 RepID=A0A8J2Q5K9_9BILA|nr:unnamed protein product [Cercopithifilaria johnstoni]